MAEARDIQQPRQIHRRTKAQRAAFVAARPVMQRDDTPVPCVENRHRWHPDFEYGDTCECGAFYLLRDDDGVHIEATP